MSHVAVINSKSQDNVDNDQYILITQLGKVTEHGVSFLLEDKR